MKIYSLILVLFALISTSSQAFPVDAVLARARAIQAQGHVPVAVFDLDETLIHSALRKALSYQEALVNNGAALDASFPGQAAKALAGIRQKGELAIRKLENQYDSNSLFRQFGIFDPAFVAKLDSLMLPIYLSNEFIAQDTAYQGAVQLLAGIYQANGVVYFVTSRYVDTQMTATQQSLSHLHLFLDANRSRLMMRNEGETSIAFKTRAFQSIQQSLGTVGEVMIAAENEPENLNAMAVAFPNAILTFIRGAILNQTVGLAQTNRLVVDWSFSR